MRAREIQLLLVILGLVISTSLLLNPPELWSVSLSFLTLSGTLIAFSTWVRNRTLRSRSILSNGAAAWLAAALWLKYLLTPVEPALRWPLAIALAWAVAPFAAFALTSLAERLAPGPLQ